MYPNKQVSALRKEGRLEEALEIGLHALSAAPDDLWLKRSIAWVYYDHIKRASEQTRQYFDKNQQPPAQILTTLRGYLRDYAKLSLPRPDMAFSNIVRVITAVGRQLDFFVPFLGWAGLDSFDSEDYKPFETDKGTVPAQVTRIAREAIAWCYARPQELDSQSAFVLELATLALRNKQEASANLIWVRYDRAGLYLRIRRLDDAAADMREVLKNKRHEYWAWTKMAEIEAARAPDLAIACYAQAMLCRPDRKFTGKLHLHFGDLLHQQGELAAAITEYLAAADVYKDEGWPFPEELEAALQASWFDPSHANSDQDRFYRSYADAALRLTYSRIQQLDATFLEHRKFKSDDGKIRTRTLFAIDNNGQQEQMLARWPGKPPRELQLGAPLHLTIGEDGKRATLLTVAPRPDGQPWDCLQLREAIVDSRSKDGRRYGLYLSPDTRAVLIQQLEDGQGALQLGDAVQVWVCRNTTKANRLEAFHPRRLSGLPMLDGIEPRKSNLRLHTKGFGFVEDAYVPHDLADPALDGQVVNAICIQDFNKAKQTYGWKVVRLEPLKSADLEAHE